ncbi:MAG: tRNA (adenosine(37)-N6)-threonylcarbamoyltransferase complex transferase subunit TsaD [Planctomycetota bacterium]
MTLGLGIDTSFDDTAVSLVEDGRTILANLTVSQFAEHEEFGGVLPERASRLHIQQIFPLLDAAFQKAGRVPTALDYVAVTHEPGLMGSLLVGAAVGKAVAMALQKPLIGVNHLEAHVFAAWMDDETLKPPFLTLLISGANTILLDCRDFDDFRLVGGTLDDAVGECLDKCGRALGLSMPAGPALQELALKGNPRALRLPRPMLNKDNFDFSFSGLKTAVAYALRDNPELPPPDVAAALLAAAAEVLSKKTLRAAEMLGHDTIVVCGGVAANLQIREACDQLAENSGKQMVYPSLALCTDNAAMIAGLGWFHFKKGKRSAWDLPVRALTTWKRLHQPK